MARKKKLKAVYLEWLDAHCLNGWHAADAEVKLRIISIGFIVYEDGERIVISTSRDESEGVWTEQLTIPKRAILRRRQLKL